MDIRAEAAQYYDLRPPPFDDISFYKDLIPSPDASVLELGCGTGRVLVPLAGFCGYIHGIDKSEAMLAICQRKLMAGGIPSSQASVEQADITDFDLGARFDLITAPFRVFQNLETDVQVEGLFRCVRKHLSSSGTCILNAFRPYGGLDTLRRDWQRDDERLNWDIPIEGGRITRHERRSRMDPDRLILYPEHIYRRWAGSDIQDEAILAIAMRCWYPEDFEAVIINHGFEIINRWGGYSGEPYGEGPELVIQFADQDGP